MMRLAAVRAFGGCSLALLEFVKADRGIMVCTADSADNLGKTACSMVAELVTIVAAERLRSVGCCGEGSPNS